MNIENRLKLLESERGKILGFGRSHLRSIASARKLFAHLEKVTQKNNANYPTPQAFRSWIWETVRSRCDDMQRRGSFQFRVFDEGALEFLDQDLMRREGIYIGTQLDKTELNLPVLPNRARAVLLFFYQKNESIQEIAKKISVTENEAYALWQHSLIYLWEELDSEFTGFRGKDDENFWTLALRYLDGTASEKFVSELNQEIHINKTRTKEFNDLRCIDGVLIALGETERWPQGHNFEDAIPVKKATKPGAILMPSSVGVAVGVVGETSVLFSETEKPSKKESKPKDIVSKTLTEPVVEAAPKPVADTKPVLATENIDEDTRHGVMFDKSPSRLPKLPAIKFDTIWLKRLGLLLLTILGALSLVQLIKGSHVKSTILSVKGVPRVLQSSNLNFIKSPTFDGYNLQHGHYQMDSGTLKFQTPDAVDLIVEAPAKFEIRSDSHIVIQQGRMVVKVPSTSTLESFIIESQRFQFTADEGEFGLISDHQSTDLLVFIGEGQLIEAEQQQSLVTGDGLRFFDVGEPQAISPQDEAHRFPESIPVLEPKAYGENLIVNHGFEVGLLSRSTKTERLFRDIPSGWIAGWQKQGAWQPPLEQHSGTIHLTNTFGGLPKPAGGERYLWINHGFVSQPLTKLEAGQKYRLSVQIGSHQNFGPSAGHLVRHVGGNLFQFGIWSGKRWIAESSGQLKTGEPFKEIVVEFECPTDIDDMAPYLMLTGETRVFYDDIQLIKVVANQSVAPAVEVEE